MDKDRASVSDILEINFWQHSQARLFHHQFTAVLKLEKKYEYEFAYSLDWQVSLEWWVGKWFLRATIPTHWTNLSVRLPRWELSRRSRNSLKTPPQTSTYATSRRIRFRLRGRILRSLTPAPPLARKKSWNKLRRWVGQKFCLGRTKRDDLSLKRMCSLGNAVGARVGAVSGGRSRVRPRVPVEEDSLGVLRAVRVPHARAHPSRGSGGRRTQGGNHHFKLAACVQESNWFPGSRGRPSFEIPSAVRKCHFVLLNLP